MPLKEYAARRNFFSETKIFAAHAKLKTVVFKRFFKHSALQFYGFYTDGIKSQNFQHVSKLTDEELRPS